MPKNAVIFTLGCRLNSADSALMVNRLKSIGVETLRTDSPVEPDVVIVNSCCVTSEAARKSRQLLRKLRRKHPEALLIAAGCGATTEGFAECGADIVLDNPAKRDLAGAVANRLAPPPRPVEQIFTENAVSDFPFLSRAFIKIQEGCNNFCTYCIVPYTRGRERSRDRSEVISDCRRALKAGYPELVLTGVNTCAYSDGGTLGSLVSELAALPGNFRIRLSSTEPHPDNIKLLDAMHRGGAKVCRFLHLSLQHGCDRMLQAMNRHYTTSEYAESVRRARELMPDIHLGTDIIVGFPGETEEDFERGMEFIESVGFANTHLFTYSRRAGTPAAKMPDQVAPETARRRYEKLKEIHLRSKYDFAARFVGRSLPVIYETRKADGLIHGWSDNYLAVAAKSPDTPLDRIVESEMEDILRDGTLIARTR